MTTDERLDPTQAASQSLDVLVHRAVQSHPWATAEVMSGLAWSVSDEDELLEFLQRTVDLAVRVVGGASSAGITAQVGHQPFTAAATDENTLDVDAAQYAAGDGPCLHAMRTRQVVHVDLDAVRVNWPDFAPHAADGGVHAFLASPLGTDDECLGALNLYCTDDDGFSPDDTVLLGLLSHLAQRSICDYARLRAVQDLATQLREAMTSRAPIEQAKGILMAARGLSAAEAFELLRVRSQHDNVKLHTLARRFVEENSAPVSSAG